MCLTGEWKLLLQGEGKEDSMVRKNNLPLLFYAGGRVCCGLETAESCLVVSENKAAPNDVVTDSYSG